MIVAVKMKSMNVACTCLTEFEEYTLIIAVKIQRMDVNMAHAYESQSMCAAFADHRVLKQRGEWDFDRHPR